MKIREIIITPERNNEGQIFFFIRVNVSTKSVHSKIFNKLINDIEQQSIFECNIHENDEVQAEDEVIKKAVLHMNNLLSVQASHQLFYLYLTFWSKVKVKRMS